MNYEKLFSGGLLIENIPCFFYGGGMQFCKTCMQAFCLILTSTLSIAYVKTQYISYQEDYTLIDSWILKVLLLIRESRWLAVLVHIEFFKWIFCTTMSLYNFPFLRILLCLVWLRQWDILCFYMKKKAFMEVDISIFTMLTYFYKILHLLRSPYTSMTINLNKIIFLCFITITRDPPYQKHMELVTKPYCQDGRTYMQIHKTKKLLVSASLLLLSH